MFYGDTRIKIKVGLAYDENALAIQRLSIDEETIRNLSLVLQPTMFETGGRWAV
jgi:hypothetical protein